MMRPNHPFDGMAKTIREFQGLRRGRVSLQVRRKSRRKAWGLARWQHTTPHYTQHTHHTHQLHGGGANTHPTIHDPEARDVITSGPISAPVSQLSGGDFVYKHERQVWW